MAADFSIESVGSNLKSSLSKITKNKKLMIALGVGVVVVIFLVFRNRGSKQQAGQVVISGYPPVDQSGSVGGGSGDFSGALDNIQNNFASLLSQQSQSHQQQLELMNRNQMDQMRNVNDSILTMSENYQNTLAKKLEEMTSSHQQALAGQQTYFDQQLGNMSSMNQSLQQQLAQQAADFQAKLNSMAAQYQPYSSPSYSSSSSSSSSGSSYNSYTQPQTQAQLDYLNTSGWSQQFPNGVSSGPSSSTAGSVYMPGSNTTVYYDSSGTKTGMSSGKPASSSSPGGVIYGTVTSVTKAK